MVLRAVVSSERRAEISAANEAVAVVSSVRAAAGMAMPAGGRRFAGGGGVWARAVKGRVSVRVKVKVKRNVSGKGRAAGRRMGKEVLTADLG